MANTRSVEKRNRQALKRRARNVVVRTDVKDTIKAARTAIAGNAGVKVVDALKAAEKSLRKAGSKGVLKKRAVSRRVSRLAKAANRAKTAASAKA